MYTYKIQLEAPNFPICIDVMRLEHIERPIWWHVKTIESI